MSAVYIEESLRQVCLPGVSAASWERLRHSWVNPPCSEVAEKEREEEKEKQGENKSPQHPSFQPHSRKRQSLCARMFAAGPRKPQCPSYTVMSRGGRESAGTGLSLVSQAGWPHLATRGCWEQAVAGHLLSWPCLFLCADSPPRLQDRQSVGRQQEIPPGVGLGFPAKLSMS